MTEKNHEEVNMFQAMKDARREESIEYKDADGKDAKKKVTYEDPGIGTAMTILDLMNVGDDSGDYGDLFQQIMDHVLVAPRLSYGELDKKLPEQLHKKFIDVQNKSKKNVQIEMVWPGYRTALQIMMLVQRPSGASNMHDTLATLNREVFRHNGQPVRMEYWDMGHDGNGLGMKAFVEATRYLKDVLDYEGVLTMLTEGMRFLSNTVQFE